MPPTRDAPPLTISTRSSTRPLPPTPPPTAPASNTGPRRRRTPVGRRRREPYPATAIKEKDQPVVPTHTTEGEEKDEEDEDTKLKEAAATLAAVKTSVDKGYPETDLSDIKEVPPPSVRPSREEVQKQKDIYERLQQERENRAEFAVLQYAVEWFVRFEDTTVHKDTSFYKIHGLDQINFPKEYESMTTKGRQYGEQEGKLPHLVNVSATLSNYGKDKQTFRLDGDEVDNVWTQKIEKAMRHKHSFKTKRNTVDFKVLVEFWYARTKTGTIPEHMKTPVPMTQLQIKARQSQEKSEQIARGELNYTKRLQALTLQIVQNQKCKWQSCPNNAGGQCLETNGNHYELLQPHIRTWAQAIASNTATPSQAPQDFHRHAFLRRLTQGGRKSPKDKKQAEETTPPVPILTPMQTPTPSATDPVDDKMTKLINLQMLKMLERMTEPRTSPSATLPLPSSPAPHPASMSPRTRGYSHLPNAPPAQPSSPVSTSNWDGYIDWICNIQSQPDPRRRAAFERAGQILDGEFVTIAQIQRQKDLSTHSKWWPDTFNIPTGIGLHLAQSASAYQRWESAETGRWLKFPHNLTA